MIREFDIRMSEDDGRKVKIGYGKNEEIKTAE